MYIGDWYGADKGDINGKYSMKGMIPSLSAFFWLQHHYGYKPFETEIIYDSVDEKKRKLNETVNIFFSNIPVNGL